MKPIAHWIACAVAASGLSSAWADDRAPWPALDWPAPLRPEVIADDMRMNGRPVRLLQIRSAQDMATVERLVCEVLGQRARTTEVGARRIVSAPVGGSFVTVDLRPGRQGGVHAYVMQSRAPAPETPGTVPPAMPADSVLRSITESNDGDLGGTVSLIENRHGVDANADFFRRRFLERGWRLQSSREVPAGPYRGRVDEYEGREGRAVVVVEDRGELRSVMVNEIIQRKRENS